MKDFLDKLLDSSFMPHGHCFLWTPDILWTHVVSDITVTLSYYLIPALLIYFVRKRPGLPFPWVFWLFGVFIMACGTTHLMAVITLWHPFYRLEGLVKAFTALVSLGTAIALYPLIPAALRLRSPSELERLNRQLEEKNLALARKTRELEATQEQNFFLTAEAIPHLVWTATPEGSWDYYNKKWFEYTRLEGETGAGGGWEKVLHPEDADRFREQWSLSVRTGESREIEYRLRRGTDGAYRWHLGRNTPVRDKQGKLVKWFGTCTDIEDVKRAQAELRNSRDQLEAILRSINDAVEVYDRGESLVYANEAAARLWGGGGGAFRLGQPYSEVREKADFLDEKGQPLPPRELPTRLALEGKATSRRLMRVRVGTGDERWLLVSSTPVRDGGEVSMAVTTSHDVTELQKAEQALTESEEQLRQAQKMEAVGRLAGGIAHDFNNLLTAINGYTSMLLDQVEAESPMRDPLQEIHKAGEKAASLTHQLLVFSRKQVVVPKIIDLNQVVADVEKLLQRLIGEDVELRTSLSGNMGLVKVDPGQVEQIIMNLAVNARDAMPGGGKLSIHTDQVELDADDVATRPGLSPGPYVLMSISDTGIGMSEEIQSHLFEPFFTTKAPGKGTGLGLSTVFGIVQQANGHIEAVSRPGQGTTFNIYFPLLEDADADAIAEAKSSHVVDLTGTETVLVVEDEDSVRRMVMELLQKAGYRVLEASDGEVALHAAQDKDTRIDLLLTDLVMAKIGGWQLARLMLRIRPEMKVVYMSGYTDDAVAVQGVQESRVAFLQKPFSPTGLLLKLREVLGAPSQGA